MLGELILCNGAARAILAPAGRQNTAPQRLNCLKIRGRDRGRRRLAGSKEPAQAGQKPGSAAVNGRKRRRPAPDQASSSTRRLSSTIPAYLLSQI